MTRRRRRRGGNNGNAGWRGPAVITVVSDDDEDSDYVPIATADVPVGTADVPVGTTSESPEVVLILDQSPGPRTRAAEEAPTPAAAASPAKAKTLTPLKRKAEVAAAGDAGAESDGDDSGSGCIICMELMSEQGSHRPATLKCGHIFGEGCIRRWLREKSRCPQCNKPSKMRDVTALFNLPKKVAAGNAGASAELEQQLQQAQKQAEREAQRAQQLEQQLKRMQQELSRQQQQPSRQYRPQQQQVAGGSWQQPALSAAGGVQDIFWAAAASQLLSGRMLPEADFAAFMQHPNTRAVFNGAPVAMPQHNAQQWLHQPHVLQAMQQMQLQQLAQGQQQWLNLPPPPPPPRQQQQQSSVLQQPQLQQNVGQQRADILQEVQQQQQRLFGRHLPAGQHMDTGLGTAAAAAAGAAAGGSSGGALSAAAAAGAAAVARATGSADVASAVVPLQPLQGAAAAGSGGSVRRRVLELCFSPLRGQPGCTSAGQSTQLFQPHVQQQMQPQAAQQQLVMPGGFSLLQEFELAGSRAFDLDVEGTLLTVAEVSGGGVPPPMAVSRLRRISMLAPGCPSHTPLPREVGTVRGLARQPLASGATGSSAAALMAVATDRAGLIIAKPSTNNIVATIATRAPIWSVAWSSSSEQQLLLGLDKGRLALVDLRMTGDRALLYVSPAPATAAGAAPGPSQPWHSLVMLPQDWQQQHAAGVAGDDTVTPEALLASAGGVYCWSSAQPGGFQLLLPSSLHGGQCESLALAPDGCTVAASFRQPLGYNRPNCQPVHYLMQLGACQSTADADAAMLAGPVVAPAGSEAAAAQPSVTGGLGMSSSGGGIAGAVAAGRRELLASTLQLTGHSSQQLMTRGCFMPGVAGLPSEPLLLASADEQSCTPRLWGCGSGAGIRQYTQWHRMSSPVLQVAGGTAAAFNTVLLGALSERQLKLYSYS